MNNDVFVLEYNFEDEKRIFGVYNDYLKAEEDLHLLQKYNEGTCKYGTLSIINYGVNQIYVNIKPEIIYTADAQEGVTYEIYNLKITLYVKRQSYS